MSEQNPTDTPEVYQAPAIAPLDGTTAQLTLGSDGDGTVDDTEYYASK